MKVKYTGIDGELGTMDTDVTIGKVYPALECEEDIDVPFSISFIDDAGDQQWFGLDVLEIVSEKDEIQADFKNQI